MKNSRLVRGLISLGLCMVFLAIPAGNVYALPLETAVNYPAEGQPRNVAVGDFNGDGKADLATANYTGDNVSILPGNGNGTFGTKTDCAVVSQPLSVAVGDFNSDGKPDLATANWGSNNVSILINDGSGGFGTASPYAAGTNPHCVVVGDFNLDGSLDLAVANYGGNVSILLGGGDGTFAEAEDSPVAAGTSPRWVAVGDFNRDGKPDLAVANANSNNVSILLGTGTGTFTAAAGSPVAVGSAPFSVAVGDFDRDGKPDLAVANAYSNNVSILLGDGDGTFAGASPYAAGSEPWSVAVGDFNQDGKADLATANRGSNNVSILVGNGLGAFAAAVNSAAGSEPSSVAVGDFNGDGAPDLAVANAVSSNVSILLNTPSAASVSFNAPLTHDAAHPNSVAVGDFNRDGKADLAVGDAGDSNGHVSRLLGDGSGGFGAAVTYDTPTGTNSVAVGDFDRDGIPDLVTANNWDNSVSILLGDGDGAFAVAASPAVGSWPYSVAVGDFDRDGIPDLVTANNAGNNVSILLGAGDGTFAAATGSPVVVGTSPYSVAVGDFNRDGIPDLVTANNAGNNVSILLGNGDGTFGTAGAYGVGGNPYSVAVGDFDRDGIPDLATANFGSNNVSILLGVGDGTFAAATGSPVAVGTNPRYVAVGDFNLDGKPDLATTNYNASNASILLGDGDGTFGTAVSYAVGTTPWSVAVGDFNRDGRPDLVITAPDFNHFYILLNAPPLTVAPTVTTDNATNVEETEATINGTLTDDGGEACEYCFYWGTSPGVYTSHTDFSGSKTTGETFFEPLAGGILTQGTTYYFIAGARNSAGSDNGTELSFTTKPLEPTDFDANAVSSSQIDLSWTEGTGAQETMIRFRTDGDYPTTPYDGQEAFSGSGTSYSHTSLTPNTTYRYKAWSWVEGSDIWSDEDAMAYATTPSGVVAPTVTTDNATNVEETEATINGTLTDDGGEACEYCFYWGTSPGVYTSHTDFSGSKNTGETFLEPLAGGILTPGTTYYFIAGARNSAGSDNGTELSFTTKPFEPTGFDATAVSSSQIDLSWTEGTGAQETMIRFRTDGNFPTTPYDGQEAYSGSGTSYSHTGLTPNTMYRYKAWSWVEGSDIWSDEDAMAYATTPGGGDDEIGFYRTSTRYFYLDMDGDFHYAGSAERFGPFLSSAYTNLVPLSGDWDGDGTDEIGFYRTSTRYFYLDMDGDFHYDGSAERFGPFLSSAYTNLVPLSGDWDGDLTDEIGFYRSSTRYFYLDKDGDFHYDGSAAECRGPFLSSAYTNVEPLSGNWDGL